MAPRALSIGAEINGFGFSSIGEEGNPRILGWEGKWSSTWGEL